MIYEYVMEQKRKQKKHSFPSCFSTFFFVTLYFICYILYYYMFAKHIIHCYIIFYMLYTILLYVLQYTILLYVFCHISASRRQNANSIHMYTNTSTYIHTYVHIYITASRKRWSSLRRSGKKKLSYFFYSFLSYFIYIHI